MVFHRLQELQCGYGVMPFSSTLWDHCIDTKDCILARLAIIPLVQEARGLDAGPRFAQRLRSSDDSVSADIVAKIAEVHTSHQAYSQDQNESGDD